MLADAMVKALGGVKHGEFVEEIELRYAWIEIDFGLGMDGFGIEWTDLVWNLSRNRFHLDLYIGFLLMISTLQLDLLCTAGRNLSKGEC